MPNLLARSSDASAFFFQSVTFVLLGVFCYELCSRIYKERRNASKGACALLGLLSLSSFLKSSFIGKPFLARWLPRLSLG